MAASQRYRSNLVQFFRWLHEHEYAADHEFAAQDLEQVTEDDVMNFFKYLSFDTITPDYNDHNLRMRCRYDTILFKKKSLSWFFRHHGLENNKTISVRITELLKVLDRMELRGQGQPSTARRPLSHVEFQRLITMLETDQDARNTDIRRYGIPAMISYQFQMICRSDCATQLTAGNLGSHDRFPYHALKTRLTWSKNVREARDCPWQTLLGCLNTKYCVMIHLGIWLEVHLETPSGHLSPYVFAFSDDNTIPSGGHKSKRKVSEILRAKFQHEFQEPDFLGTHSLRKFARTHCRNNGASIDDADSRARWKDTGRMSNRYEDVDLPFVDIKTCITLCQGGACGYVVKPECVAGLTDDFVSDQCPNICEKYGREVALVFGKAIIWTSFSADHADWIPNFLRNRIMLHYNALPEESRLPEGENPIERKQLFLTGTVNNFQLNDNFDVGAVGQIIGGGGDIVAGVGIQNIAMLHAAINQIERSIATYAAATRDATEANRNSIEAIRGGMLQLQTIVARNFNRINRHPLRMLNAAAAGDAPVVQPPIVHGPEQRQPDVDQNADLSPTPRTLHELWREWEFGIGGRKAARLFTARERGQKKSTFCRRKAFWEVVQLLIRRGHSSDQACDQIYQAYGQPLSVTQIIDAMIVDRRNNTSPFRDNP